VNYIIPANTKKSMLKFGLFNTFDLILFGSGIAVSLILLLLLPVEELKFAIIAILPGLVTGFLVFPIPYYHNVLTVIINFFSFYTSRQQFVWKGWCVTDGKEDDQ
jgi:hypothetical protein